MSEADKDLDLLLDSLAQAEREGYEKGLGEGLRSVIDGAVESREDGDRALLDAINRARLASQSTEPGDDAA